MTDQLYFTMKTGRQDSLLKTLLTTHLKIVAQ